MAFPRILRITAGLAIALGGTALVARKLFAPASDSDYTNGVNGTTSMSTNPTPLPPREGLDPTLLEILACPDDKQPVIYQKEGDAERLTCTKCGKRYPVRDGIPVMLIDEATTGPVPTEAEITAAHEMAPQGKPALVGTAASSSSSSSSAGTSTGTGTSTSTTSSTTSTQA